MVLAIDSDKSETSAALALLEAEAEELPVDLAQLRAIPIRKTMLLINNFVANTSRFLNHFALVCENKCNTISTKLTRLEVSLVILETKLNSIPDLEAVSSPQNMAESTDLPPPVAENGKVLLFNNVLLLNR